MAAPTPLPGKPVARRKPYVYVTWLAKLLGSDAPCMWAGWFKAHHKYFKVERDAESLQEWNRDHTMLMQRRSLALEADGWTVHREDANKFTLEGARADVAGKPDIVAVQDDQVLLVDGKTGKRRDADLWQVRIYLWALPLVRPDLKDKALAGEVQYKAGGARAVDPPTSEQLAHAVSFINVLAADAQPSRAPSQWECARCDIHIQDCPKRWQEQERRADVRAAGF